MTLEDRLRAYVEHLKDGGNPEAPGQPLSDDDHEVWVHWRGDGSEGTRLEIHVDDERYGCFVDGRRTDPSWEGGVDGPDVDEWETVREL